MTTPAPLPISDERSRTRGLALLAAGSGLLLGGAALWLGVAEDAIALWGFGAACLSQVPQALNLRRRIQEGLGNRGLDRERSTLRIISHLLRLLALAMALAAAAALFGHRAPETSLSATAFALLAFSLQAALWRAKLGLAGKHTALALDATRARVPLELAALLLMGLLLGHWLPWADAATGLAIALRLFIEGRSLSKITTLQAACGGCGCGCK